MDPSSSESEGNSAACCYTWVADEDAEDAAADYVEDVGVAAAGD